MCFVIIDLFNSNEVAGRLNESEPLELAVLSSFTNKFICRVPAAAAAAAAACSLCQRPLRKAVVLSEFQNEQVCGGPCSSKPAHNAAVMSEFNITSSRMSR
jgi:hypothetical protein